MPKYQINGEVRMVSGVPYTFRDDESSPERPLTFRDILLKILEAPRPPGEVTSGEIVEEYKLALDIQAASGDVEIPLQKAGELQERVRHVWPQPAIQAQLIQLLEGDK